jgi:gliding motility-associated-like protein
MSWLFNRQVISDSSALDLPLPNSAGPVKLSFTAVTAQGCADTVQKNVVIHALPVPGAVAADTLVCAGHAVQLHASGGGTYYWQSGQPVKNEDSPEAIAVPSESAEYVVTVTTPFGCIQKDTVVIRTADPVALAAPPAYSICRGDTVRLSASGNTGSFSWYPSTGINDPGTASPLASPGITTHYLVIGHSRNICPDDSATVNVKVLDDPAVDLGGDTAVPAGVPFTLYPQVSDNVVHYEWTPAAGLSCSTCANPVALPEDSQLYLLHVSTPEGCKATDSIMITLLCNKQAIYIPTAFTPNGDRLNDRFYIRGFGLKTINYLRIFDRWGREVFNKKHFAANDQHMGWDGNLPGGNLPAATSSYAYIAEVVCSEGIPVIVRGTVTLIR